MPQFLQLFLAAGLTFVAIDALWLGVVAKKMYQNHLGAMLRNDPLMGAAAAFYLVFIVGLVFFVVQPAIEKSSWIYAASAGALFGFVTYATYDLTNLATLKGWPVKLTVIDLLWGAVLAGIAATVAYSVGKWLS